MIASGGLSGGISSSIAGGSFWSGVREGIITSGLNHAMNHLVMNDGGGGGNDNKVDKGTKPKDGTLKVIKKVTEKVTEVVEFSSDFIGGVSDFIEVYSEMKEANWINSDKYFHSKANFKASLRGSGGRYVAEKMSNLREIVDQRIKGDSRADSMADQKANSYGRLQAQKLSCFRFYNLSYGDALPKYRPINLPLKY